MAATYARSVNASYSAQRKRFGKSYLIHVKDLDVMPNSLTPNDSEVVEHSDITPARTDRILRGYQQLRERPIIPVQHSLVWLRTGDYAD